MKRRFLPVVLLLVVLLASAVSLPASASTVTQDGLVITLDTNKTAYEDWEQISATVSVKNTSPDAVTNIRIENFVPEGYKLATGSSVLTTLSVLQPGTAGELKSTYVVDAPPVPHTKDASGITLWLLLATGAMIALLVMAASRKRWHRMLSLLLCVTMVTSFLPLSVLKAKAQTPQVATGSASLSREISVAGLPASVSASVTYDTRAYTRGQWADMLARKLGISFSDVPEHIDHHYADTQDNQYGLAIEALQAYGVLPRPELPDLNQDVPLYYPDQPATREFAAYTSVKAMGFDGTHEFDTSAWQDLSAIKYRNEAAIAVGFDFLALDANKRFNPGKPMSTTDANMIFKAIDALDASVIVTPETAYDRTSYADGIIKDELSGVRDYSVSRNTNSTYTLNLPRSTATLGIAPGKVLVLPSTDQYPGGIALKVATVAQRGRDLRITATAPELVEVYKRIDIAAQGTPNIGAFTAAEGVLVEYDPNGSVGQDNAGLYARRIRKGGSTPIPGTLKFWSGTEKPDKRLV